MNKELEETVLKAVDYTNSEIEQYAHRKQLKKGLMNHETEPKKNISD